jgi:hypothetical protein
MSYETHRSWISVLGMITQNHEVFSLRILAKNTTAFVANEWQFL